MNTGIQDKFSFQLEDMSFDDPRQKPHPCSLPSAVCISAMSTWKADGTRLSRVVRDPGIRAGFDELAARLGITPQIAAEVDDMAMLRLLAREHIGLAVVPPIVVANELESGHLQELHRFAELAEHFYAITPSRRFPHPLLQGVLKR
jgi:DNA-binding transcriptional LysR family regulator